MKFSLLLMDRFQIWDLVLLPCPFPFLVYLAFLQAWQLQPWVSEAFSNFTSWITFLWYCAIHINSFKLFLVRRNHVWIYGTMQFCLVVLCGHLFFKLVRNSIWKLYSYWVFFIRAIDPWSISWMLIRQTLLTSQLNSELPGSPSEGALRKKKKKIVDKELALSKSF